MMFDPPDYPYKELSESYDPDDLLFTNVTDSNEILSSGNKNSQDVTTIMNSVENHLTFHSNDSGRYFNIENSSFFQENNLNMVQNTELYIVQSDNMFNYEPTLLDENTVNQFLLPLPESSENNQTSESTGPDLLALHSCVICHEIFTTEADLLDHTISLHTSDNSVEQLENTLLPTTDHDRIETKNVQGPTQNNENFETEWLVCRMCERVLSTALEVEPTGKNNYAASPPMVRVTWHLASCILCMFAISVAVSSLMETLSTNIDSPASLKIRIITMRHQNDNCNLDTTAHGPIVCYACDICGKQYGSTEDLKAHSLECHKPRASRRSYTNSGNTKMWNCGSCNQLFATARELYRHKRGEDRPPGAPLMAYVCEECDKVLGSMCALHTHKKMHKVTKPGYPCRVCGRRFNQSGHLAIHMRMHTGERPYPCDLCPKAFKVKVERDDHRRTHTGEKPFACTACPKTFTAAARLREHARIHTDQRRSGDMWKHKRTLHGVQAVTDLKK
ncbi:hypothetical protein HW555_009846 [Spodoptera exigua]|uniref:C2H2-type domain-containing protein n=1 Tax=Spodoptera exigua TaxID=7107 RepID=A0A835G9W6_SPOEX|nr:hypothetical protein HW555_009846 [Spodoptera exigua]